MAVRSALKQRIAAGEVALGISCTSGNVHAAEMCAHSELDYVYLDQQHGMTPLDTLVNQLRALAGSPVTPLVRVLRNDPGLIGQALDAGAQGVIVPMVNTVEEARNAAQACRYPPDGVRSWGPLRARFGLGTDPALVNPEVFCFVMVENRAGLKNVHDIVHVPGVDGIYVGPADLAVSMGLKPRLALQEGEHADAVAQIVAACRGAGRVAAISGNPREMGDLGFGMVSVGSDTAFIQAGLDRVAAHRRELT
ncbi:MAG: aldolase/citrate lyase family protein [Mycobacterium sp.]|uniref:HpcH/HpaI aldolase family protein n=1 Tax=Mycobacterium sp. TaxID=1785 RepID=UPI003CBB9E07